MLSLSILLIVMTLLCVGLLYAGSWRIITPLGVIGYAIIIYYLFKMIWNVAFGVRPLFNISWNEFIVPFSIVVAVLGGVLILSYPGSVKYRAFFARPNLPSGSIKPIRFNWLFWLFYFSGPPFALILGRLYLGMWAWDAPIVFRAFIQSAGMMYLYVLVAFTSQLGIIFIFKALLVERKFPSIMLLLGVPAILIYSINTGFTSTIIAIFVPMLYYLSFRKGVRFEILLPIAIPLAGFFAITHLIYKRSFQTGEVQTFGQAVSQVVADPEQTFGFLNRLDYPEQYVLAIDHSLNQGKIDFGQNIVGAFIQPIPRMLWPSKPLTFSAYMTREVDPGHFEAGISANYGGIAELINAFWLWGIFPAIGLLALYVHIGNRLYIKACKSDYSLMVYIFVFLPLVIGSIIDAFLNDLSVFNCVLNYCFIRIFTSSVPMRIPKIKFKLARVYNGRRHEANSEQLAQ